MNSNNGPLISVVVPVYKVENFLDRCVQSLVDQTYRNLEIILVDDGSPDRCGEMCDQWAQKDSRIKVIHKKNGGLSDARNFGIEQATGDYITFIDSDDYIAKDYVAYLYEMMEKYGADVSACKYRITYGDGETFDNQPEEKIVELNSGREAIQGLFGEHYMQLVTAWGKLYPMDMVKKNLYPVGRLHEDEATTYKYYYGAKKVVLGTHELYGYYQNPNSITHQKNDKNIEHTLMAYEEQKAFYAEKGEAEFVDKVLASQVEMLIRCADQGSQYARQKLKEIPLLSYLRANVGKGNKLNFIGWKLLKVDLYARMKK